MKNNSNIHQTTLENGIRILVEPVEYVQSASVGLFCQTGSANELDNEAGITHLIEHMLFKGTEKRTSHEISQAIEGRGGELNAYTDKETTCYYCKVLADDANFSIEVLGDMLRHSKFDLKDLTLEKGVILEEIVRALDEPSHVVHEEHLENRWHNHPLGKPIIGTKESVSGFSREDILKYLDRRYSGGNILLAVTGNVDPDAIVATASEVLASIPSTKADTDFLPPVSTIKDNFIEKDVEGIHFCIGTDGQSDYDPDYFVQSVLVKAIGGNMSSRLFQEIREKRGLAYAIGTYALRYSNGGAINVYGGTSPSQFEEVKELVFKEFAKIKKYGLDEEELERTKHSMKALLVLGLESMSSRMSRMARHELTYQRQISIEETIAEVDAVTNKRIFDVAERFFQPKLFSTTVVGPVKKSS